ncbi:uncharacterized protein isoform X2 [Rhodnius prolixus]|uniref:uncharacterized protein isoform X2 n=1 Tax=Rhodnius prolixus TaxID=13249 RepID=UPI003D18D2E8
MVKPLTMSVAVSATLFLAHRCVHKFFKNMERSLKKELKIDIYNINHLLTFGTGIVVCPGHKYKQFDCGNLSCNYGRLSFILHFINNSKKYLDVCIYIITAEIFGEAIISAYRRGVRVRVIADSDMSFSAQSYVNNFRKEELPTRQKMSPYIMHHKFIIVDNEIIINGSMNFTMTGVFCNWENVMISSQPHIVSQFVDGFQALWDDFAPDLERSPVDDPLLKKHTR